MSGTSSGISTQPDSCGCNFPVCVGGKTYYADVKRDLGGNFINGYYTDENLSRIDLIPGNFTWGECAILNQDVLVITMGLVAGSNVVTHSLNKIGVEVEVRNAATGHTIDLPVTNRTPDGFTLTAAVPVASAMILIDA